MKTKRKNIFIVFGILLFLCALTVIYLFRSWLLTDPFHPLMLTEVNSVCSDQDGNIYVIDSAGERLLKASADGTLQWQVKSSDSGFEKAVRVCTDKDGNVYVQDKSVRNGIRLKSEAILKYSPDGVYEQAPCRIRAGDDQIRPSIVGLFRTDGEAYAVTVDETGLAIRTVLTPETRAFPKEDANEYVLDAVWDKSSDTLWYCTFNGQIFRYVDGKNDELLYNNSEHVKENESVPRAVSYRDGIIYAADRGLRCVAAIDNSTGAVTYLEEDIEWSMREVYDSVNADYAILSTTGSFVKLWEEGTCVDIDSFVLSPKLRMLACLLWVCLGIIFIFLFVLLVLIAVFIVQKASTMTRIVTAVLIGVSILSAMVIGTLFPNFREQMYNSKFDKAEFCASLACEEMDIDAFLNLDEASDYMGEDYLAVRNAVNGVFKTNSATVDDLYCTMYRVIGDHDTISITYSMDENSMILPYDWEYEGSDEQDILTTGKGKKYVNRSVEGSYLFVLDPILDRNGTPVGLIEVGTDLQSFENEMRKVFIDLLLNLIAITAVGVMCMIEIIYFFRGQEEFVHARKPDPAAGVAIPAGVLRMAVFLVFFFTNLTTAVLPNYSISLARAVRIPGVSAEIMAAIPFSAEVISGALFSIFGADLIRAFTLKRASLLCAVLFSVGLSLRIIPNYWMIILGSLVVGMGWGVILLIVNVLIAGMPGDEKDIGFAYYNTAALNGVNSGTVFGGFLLNWVSIPVLFVLTAIGSLTLLLLVWKYLIYARMTEEDPEENGSVTEGKEQKSFLHFILSPNILTFFAMLVIPVLTGSYFLIYLYPIIGTKWGLSETYVGYSFLLNGLCVMALSTFTTNFFTRLHKKRLGLTLSALLYAAAFSLVAYFRSVPSLLAALVLLGFSDSFGLPLQTSWYTDQEETIHFGLDRSFGVYSLFENVSQALGPFVFSWALVVGVPKGLSAIAGVIAAAAVVFLFAGNILLHTLRRKG